MEFSPPTIWIPIMNPSKEFEPGITQLAERTPSSGLLFSSGNFKIGQFRFEYQSWIPVRNSSQESLNWRREQFDYAHCGAPSSGLLISPGNLERGHFRFRLEPYPVQSAGVFLSFDKLNPDGVCTRRHGSTGWGDHSPGSPSSPDRPLILNFMQYGIIYSTQL